MDVTVVEEKQKEAALAVFRAVSRTSRVEWVRARLFWSEIGGSIGSFLAVWDADDVRSGVPVPDEVDEPLGALRGETERPGEGAWLSVFLTVTNDGRYTYAYDYEHRPSWTSTSDPLSGHPGDSPTDESLIADLARHPRRPEALPAWYPTGEPGPADAPVARPSSDRDAEQAPLAPPAPVADVVALPGWDVVWQAVVAHLDRVVGPVVARELASTPPGERVRETDDLVRAVWDGVWDDTVVPLDGQGVVRLWEPWARSAGRDPEIADAVDPRSRPSSPDAPLDRLLQDVGDVVDGLVAAALDARVGAVDEPTTAGGPTDDAAGLDARGHAVALAEQGRLRVVDEPGTELAVSNGDTGFQVAASDLGFDVASTERGRARVRATASTLDLAFRVLLWELRVPVRAELRLERIAVTDDLASVPSGVDVEADTRAVTISWRSAAGAEWVSFPGSGGRRSAVGFSRVAGLDARAIVDVVLAPDAADTLPRA